MRDATDLPVILYDIPGRTGVPIKYETILRIAKHPNVLAIKDAKGGLPLFDVAHSVIYLKPHATHLSCVVDLVPPGDAEARLRVTEFANQLPAAKKAAQYVEVIFADAPFTAENGMLRPNMKIDRKAVAARYL